jgi:hypothetical protein
MSARRPFRGPAGAIDPRDPEPFDAVAVRSAAYYELLAHVDHHLGECIEALTQVTPPEPDLRHLREIRAAAQTGIIRPRPARGARP